MRGGKGFFLLFLFLALGSLLLAVVLWPSNNDKWTDRTRQIETMKREARARTLPHSSFHGELTPGNAWKDYDIALQDVAAWREDDTGFIRYLQGEKQVDRAGVEELVAQRATLLEHLQRGARRSDGQFPYKWELGHRMPQPTPAAVQHFASLAVIQARILAEKGQTQQAADLLFDVTVLGRDVATNGPLTSNLVGLRVYASASDELRHLLLSGKLTQKQLIEVQRKLEIVIRDFPSLSGGFAGDMLLIDNAIQELADGGLGNAEWRGFVKHGNWRLAVSPTGTGFQSIEEKDGYLRRFEKLENVDFATAKKEVAAIDRDVSSSKNELIRIAMPNATRVLTGHHYALTRLLLLQAAAGFLATGQTPTLRDPFGDKLLSEQNGGKAKFWSLGRDGTNQNGRGDWVGGEPDLVFEIK
jgi:hypothetical protein